MAERMAAFDWSAHPLGPIAAWPQSLRTSVSLMLNSQHPMWIGWGPQMSFLYNDAYLHVLGLAKHPWALGRPASEVWAEIWDVCGPLADKVFRDGEASFMDDVRLFMSRGDFLEETFYSFSYSPIRDESGEVGGLFCPSTDVTPKVIGARRLRTLSELGANALAQKSPGDACASAAETLAKNPDDVPFAVLYLFEDGECIAKEWVGLPPESTLVDTMRVEHVVRTAQPEIELVKDHSDTPLGPADRPVAEALILPVAGSARTSPLGALAVGINPTRRLDDDYRAFFELVATNIGTAIQSARAAEDERRRADMLTEMDRAKTTFFSNVSHEFRTPLTLMLGPLEEISRHADGNIAPLVDAAQRNSLRLLKLVNTLLEFSRIEAGRADAAFAETDLASLTIDLCSSFRSAIESAGLDFALEIDLARPAFVDRTMWEKIVLNLLSNALKFTLSGEIRVTLTENAASAELRVRDTGTGIPEAELPHVFERFHRIRNDEARSHEGTGIGLALTRDLVNLHGGSIAVTSTLGAGSEFCVRIPLGRAHLDSKSVVGASVPRQNATGVVDQYLADVESTITRSAAATVSPRSGGDRPKILLADDNGDLRDYVQRILAPHFDVDAVGDGVAALELARAGSYDLIVSDVMMPKMDGFELLQAVRSDERLSAMPFICLSARAGESEAIKGLERGADAYLVKPFSAGDLIARIEAQLQSVRRRQDVVTQQAVKRWFDQAGDSSANDTIFRAFADQLPIVIYQQDVNGALNYVNTAWYELTGLPKNPSSLTGDAWKNVIHPDEFDDVIQWIGEAIPARQAYEFEYRVKRADRDETAYRWYMARSFPQFTAAGEFRGWIGSVIDINDARRAAEQLDVFARLGVQTGETLDRKSALLSFSNTLVPTLADWCLVTSADETGALVLTEARHHDPAKNALLSEFIGKPYERRGASTASRHVFETGEPFLYERATIEDVRGLTEPAFERVLEAVGFHSLIVVPISAGGRIRGTFHAVSNENGRIYTAEDVPFFQEVGRRMGYALENAETFEQQTRIARSFQDAALPPSLPRLPGIEFSSLYSPATTQTRVGGDFYDAFRLLDGRLVVSIGDVAGSGLDAAATMAALRQSIRAAASINPDPQMLLKAADGVFYDDGRAPFASAFVALIEPLTFSMQYASAGHPPVLLRTPRGEVVPLGGKDLLLGVQGNAADTERHVRRRAIEPGSMLVLYTDGLIEATHDPAEGEFRLSEAVSALNATAETARHAAAAIRDGVLGPHGSSHDDVAILTVFLQHPMMEASDSDVTCWQFACDDATAAHNARNQMCSLLHGKGMSYADLFAAEMVFSELVGNALNHAGTAIDVAIDLTQDHAVLHVLDSGPGFSLNPKLPSEPYSEHGRGLFIVKELAREFTTSPRTLTAGTHARAVLYGAIRRSRRAAA